MTAPPVDKCPKCGFGRQSHWIDCPACGVIYARYRRRPPPEESGQGAGVFHRRENLDGDAGNEAMPEAPEDSGTGSGERSRVDAVPTDPGGADELRLRWATTSLAVSVSVAIGTSGVLVACNLEILKMLGQDEPDGSWLAEAIRLLGALNGLAVVTSILLFALWIYRAYDNLRLLRVGRTRSNPAAVVTSLFVPALNLVHPPLAIDELWRTTSPELDPAEVSSWRRQPVAIHVWVWWVASAFVGLLFLESVAAALGAIELAEIRRAVELETAALCGLVVVAAATLWLVLTIDARQRKRRTAILAGARERSVSTRDTVVYSAPALSPTTCLLAMGLALAASSVWTSFVFTFLPSLVFPLVLLGAQAALLGSAALIAQLERVPFRRLIPTARPSIRAVMGAVAIGAGVLAFNVAVTVPLLSGHRLETAVELADLVPSIDPMIAFLTTLGFAVFVAPIVEEALFRGVVYEAIEGVWTPVVAVIGSAALFALVHVEPVRLPVTFLIGLLCGVARLHTGSLVVPVVIHAANNLGTTLLPLLDAHGRPPLWLGLPSLALVAFGLDRLGIGKSYRDRGLRLAAPKVVASRAAAVGRALGRRLETTVLTPARRRKTGEIASKVVRDWKTVVPTVTLLVTSWAAVVAVVRALASHGAPAIVSYFRFLFLALVALAIFRGRRKTLVGCVLALVGVLSAMSYRVGLFWTAELALLTATIAALFLGGRVRLPGRDASDRVLPAGDDIPSTADVAPARAMNQVPGEIEEIAGPSS